MWLLLPIILLNLNGMTLFDFTPGSDISDWRVVNDTVMGGVSSGQFQLNEAGHGEFSGHVSLENNGGFSSLRYDLPTVRVADYKTAVIRLRGDGKTYQFRVKSTDAERFSYVNEFTTSGEWEEIEIDLGNLYPQFRGQRLRRPNYPGETLSEVAFLIGNKKEQDFRLEIDWIRLR